MLTGSFALGVLLNGTSRSRLDGAVTTPVTPVHALCCLVVALA